MVVIRKYALTTLDGSSYPGSLSSFRSSTSNSITVQGNIIVIAEYNTPGTYSIDVEYFPEESTYSKPEGATIFHYSTYSPGSRFQLAEFRDASDRLVFYLIDDSLTTTSKTSLLYLTSRSNITFDFNLI